MTTAEIQERLKKSEDTLREKPYNLDAWAVLIRHAQNQDIKRARKIYEALLKHFPTSGRYWKSYIDHEMKARCYEHVEKLFKRCLNTVLNVDLWKSYIAYIKDQKAAMIRNEPKIRADGTQRPDPVYTIREQIVSAYDFALDKIGIDIHSYGIWSEYIDYLKTAPPPRTSLNLPNPDQRDQYFEGLRHVAIRKIYKRAVVTPLLQLEGIWRDYCSWEQSINPQIAKKETELLQREYLIAKRVARELDQITRGLNRNAPALPPSGGNSTDERRQIEMWRKIIEWEKCNNSKSSENTMVIKRVIFSYEQCLQCMAHHSGMWFEAAEYMIESMDLFSEKNSPVESELKSQIIKLFERALSDDSPVRASMLLHFQYAEFLERNKMFEQVNRIYSRLYQSSLGGGLVRVDGQSKTHKQNKDDDKLNGNLENHQLISPLNGLRAIIIKDPTLAYIQHMRFARRVEGIKSARNIFKRARADNRCKFHVYVFAAKMEYACTKDMNVSQKIYELGLKKYQKDPEFLQQYTKFMRMLNESNNTRVLYERVLNENQNQIMNKVDINKEVASSVKFLWSDYTAFESMVGDLASITGVEKRKIINTVSNDAYSITNPITLAAKEKSVLTHHTNLLTLQQQQPHTGRVSSQPFNAQTQKLENDIANYKNDDSHIKSDVIQRHKTNVKIARYSFLDLDACPNYELKSLGVDEKSLGDLTNGLKQNREDLDKDDMHDEGIDNQQTSNFDDKVDAVWRLGRRPMADMTSEENRKKYTENEAFVRPIFSQMTPFKPEHHPLPTKFGVAGGNFPPPPAARSLMRMMPPPRCFLGPFVIVDQLLDKIRSLDMPQKTVFVQAIKSGTIEKAIKIKKENIVHQENLDIVTNSNSDATTSAATGSKRSQEEKPEENQREEIDIFTRRQREKAKKIRQE